MSCLILESVLSKGRGRLASARSGRLRKGLKGVKRRGKSNVSRVVGVSKIHARTTSAPTSVLQYSTVPKQ